MVVYTPNFPFIQDIPTFSLCNSGHMLSGQTLHTFLLNHLCFICLNSLNLGLRF